MGNPDLEMAKRFLALLGPGEDFTFQTFADGKEDAHRAAAAGYKPQALQRVLHGSFSSRATELARLNQMGAGVFVMVNRGDGITREGRRTCRTNGNVVAVRALFADADGIPLQPILDKSPPPHILVESSPDKWHLYWLTRDTPLEEFTVRQGAIAELLGTDPAVKDLARVMRLPGFYHQKGEPFMTRLVQDLAL